MSVATKNRHGGQETPRRLSLITDVVFPAPNI